MRDICFGDNLVFARLHHERPYVFPLSLKSLTLVLAAVVRPVTAATIDESLPEPSELYLCATAAMQLISTRESPGSAATATVVRDGPP